MNMIWKRTLSLALSAVLLMSNVPFAALATENTATETQPVEIQPAFEQGTTDAANHGEGDPIPQDVVNYEIYINGQQITSANANDVTGTGLDGKITYANGILTLEDATIDAATAHAIETKIPLTIKLAGENQVTAHGPDKSAIFADMGSSLTITSAGEDTGILEATSVKSRAIYMHGQDANGNKASLTITGNVTMSAETENTAGAYGIVSPNGVVVKDGDFHLKFSAADGAIAPVALEDEQPMYMLPAGYIRTGEGFVEVQGNVPMKSGAFEFVSASHLCEDYIQSTTHHYKTCDDMQCPFCTDDVRIAYGTHENEVEEANCQSGKTCKICGEYTEKVVDNHVTPNEKCYERDSENPELHWEKFACCSKKISEQAVPHDVIWSQSGAVITKRCSGTGCGYQKTITISEKEDVIYTYDGTEKPVQVVDEINDPALTIVYAKEGDDTFSGIPTDAGTYTATVTHTVPGEGETADTSYSAQLTYTIERKKLGSDMITVNDTSGLTYCDPKDGPLTKRTVKVDGLKESDYQVEYYRGDKKIEENGDFNSAGIITVKVTVLGDDKNYYGSAEKTYEIQKASVSETAAMAPEEKELVYDGTVKTLLVTKTGADQTRDYGEKVVFYKNGEEVKDPIDAGTYTLKIHVGNQNYTDAVFESKGEPWSATIKPCKTYTASFEDEQTIGDHIAVFQPPVFTGVTRAGASEPETVDGTCVYEFTYNGQPQHNIAASEITAKLNAMTDGTQATLKFVFTPTANGNYTGTKDGTITITKAGVTFTNDGKAVNYMDLLSGGSQVVNYGAANIVNVSKLEAKSNGATDDVDAHFTVKYAMAKTGGGYDDAPEKLLNKPNAGSAQFIVFYSNPNLGGTAFENVEVTRGNITVNKIAPPTEDTTLLKPVKKELTETEGTTKEQQELITPGRDGTIPLEYSLDGTNYSSAVPKAAQAGVYRVYYRSPENANYTTPVEGHVDSVIKPYLTATFGDTLEDVVLPESGEWTWQQGDKKLEELSVGNAGVTRTYKLNYASKTVSGLTGEFTAEIHVAPKPITVKIELKEEDKHMSYKNGAAVKAAVKVTNLADNKTLTNGTDYELEYQNERKRGRATVTVTPKGNYTFTVPEEESVLEYVIYDVAAIALTDTTTFEGSNVEDKNGKDVKDALDEEFEDVYSDELRKYTYFIMKETDNTYTFEPFYWPEDGIALNINYPTNSHKDDGEYKVFAMYLVGDKAGTVIELEEATGTLGMNQFKKGESTFSVKMDNYMAICIAEKVDPNATYKVSTSASNGKVEFTVGSDTTKKTSADAVKVGEKLTITATPNSNYALTKIQYIYKDGTTNKAKEVKQNDDGKYILEMPAMDITIKATFAKKTTNTKNPYSGDTSNITLWFTVLVASGVGIAALMAFWFKKRRK